MSGIATRLSLRKCLPALLWLLLHAAGGTAQNLVPNGSFEGFNNCPDVTGVGLGIIIDYSPFYTSFPYVKDWVRPTAGQNTPDYFRMGCYQSFASVPQSSTGYQQPHTGLAYAGIIGFNQGSFNGMPFTGRETMTTRLTAKLIKGTAYCVTFYVSPTCVASPLYAPTVLNEIGANLSDRMPDAPVPAALNMPYSIWNDTARHLTDTTAWYEIRDVYIAKGGERYLTIGCFNHSIPSLTRLAPAMSAGDYTYDFIDDVSVIPTTYQTRQHQFKACDSMVGDSIVLRASDTSGSRYTWSTGATGVSRIAVRRPGNYSCRIVVNCELIIDTFIITPGRKDSLHTVNTCDTTYYDAYLSSSVPLSSYRWNTGDTSRQIHVTHKGIYACEALQGCNLVTDSFRFAYVAPDRYDTAHLVSVCDTARINFYISSSVPSSRHYKWNTGDSTRLLHVTRNGTYTCTALSGCTLVTDTFRFRPNFPDIPSLHDTTICQYVKAPNLVLPDTGLVWYSSPTDSAGSGKQPLINTDRVQKTVLYAATKRDGCLSAKMRVEVFITNGPEPHAPETVARCEGAADDELSIGHPLDADVRFAWNTGQTAPYIHPPADGIYTRTASNSCGVTTDTISVRTEPCDRCVICPSAFTPNGDGQNDGFRPLIRCNIYNYRLRIYNRWGECVFSSTDKDAYWYGRQRSIDAPVGIYMYMVSMTHSLTGREIFEKGDVSLIR